MKNRRAIRKSLSVLLAFMLSFTLIPAVDNTLTASASTSSPTIGYPTDLSSFRGGICCFSAGFEVYDRDSLDTPIQVEVYLGDSRMFSGYSDSRKFSKFCITNQTGTYTINIVLYDVDSSGTQTGKTVTYSPGDVTIRPISSFTESDIEIGTNNCEELYVRFPNCSKSWLSISDSQDDGYTILYSAGSSNPSITNYYRYVEKPYTGGTKYLRVTIGNGITLKRVTKEVVRPDHTYNDGEITTPATCTKDGVRTYTCTTCKETRTEAIPKTGHSWDSGKVTKAAKYYSTGIRTYTCKKCGATVKKTIPKKSIAKVKPAKVTIKSAKPGKKKVTVKWKRLAKNTKGYQIALKNKNNGKVKYIKVAQGKKATLSKTVSGLQRKKVYAVRIRAYNKIGTEYIYGAWSNVKSGKVK